MQTFDGVVIGAGWQNLCTSICPGALDDAGQEPDCAMLSEQ
jgi:hypothetical protein